MSKEKFKPTKSITLSSGSIDGFVWKIAVRIRVNGSIKERGPIFTKDRRRYYLQDKEKEKIRRSDRYWVETRIPFSIRNGCEIHHDWENGGTMYLIPKVEHILLHRGKSVQRTKICVGICWNCAKEGQVNTCGLCEDCWAGFPFIRGGCDGVVTVTKKGKN